MINNKRIAITGESSGIGQSCYNLFKIYDNKLFGFSRTSNCDLTVKENYNRALSTILECDIFINNAYTVEYRMLQTDLLNDIYDIWRHDSSKCILSVGSQAQYVTKTNVNEQRYATSKQMLEATIDRLKYSDHMCGVLSVNPFWVNTPMYLRFKQSNPNYVPKSLLESAEVAEHIYHLIDLFYTHKINIYSSEIRKQLKY
jgi:short-subunit dehydrogenase